MRTADTIAQQAEAGDSVKPNADSSIKSRRGLHLKPWHFKPGQSGNPGGRKKDEAKEIAQKIFRNNREAIYEAMGAALLKGNAYTFKELADRAFDKLKETVEVTTSDSILEKLAEGRKRVAERKKG